MKGKYLSQHLNITGILNSFIRTLIKHFIFQEKMRKKRKKRNERRIKDVKKCEKKLKNVKKKKQF